MSAALFFSVFLIAACGLVYELIAGTLASYLLGDSVFQFSTVIGSYLFAMGIGSYLSRFIGRGLVARFIAIELMVGLVGGFSSALLFLAFAYTQGFQLLLYAVVIVVGILVGLEIPLLMRILKERFQFRDLVAHVLTFDYLGALGASLLFPVLLYTGPSGLNLYILTSTAIGIWESKRVRDHIQAQEEAEKAGKVIVDAKATRASRRHAKEEHAEDAKKTGGIMGWIENLQNKAEEVRDASDRRDKGKK